MTPVAGGAANRRSGNTLTVWRKSADGAWQIFRDANLLSQN
jgi:ketosteroid isomerase-like protein